MTMTLTEGDAASRDPARPRRAAGAGAEAWTRGDPVASNSMARRFRRTAVRRVLDRLMTAALRRGEAPPGIWLITIPGRRTGRPYTTPVSLVGEHGGRWLVAPYGAVGWVRNLRAARRVTLTRGGRSEEVGAVGLAPREAAPVLRRYLAANLMINRYFDGTKRASLEALEREAARHPVFRLGDGEAPTR
jgi:deazaflavin-dependent oxidoreductase (nitroreductase family)